jgi:triphosphoribosyl-dephospho-CoA synthase
MHTGAALRSDPALGARAMAAAVGRLAVRALQCELELTPKPGLVDRANAGAHRDMDFTTFQASIHAIAPWIPRFFRRGLEAAHADAEGILPDLRRDGLGCERDMFTATGGVNTHKGAVFSFALLCAAGGRLHGRGDPIDGEAVCAEVAALCVGLIARELETTRSARTAGERMYREHGLTGVRGEVQSGFATTRAHGLGPYLTARARGEGEERALHEALLHLMAYNPDTNLVSRGGLDGLRFVQAEARRLLGHPRLGAPERRAELAAFDRALIERNLSPGGSADLLAVTWFLAHLGELSSPMDYRCSSDEAPYRRQDRAGTAGGCIPLRLRARPGAIQQQRVALAVHLGTGVADLEAHQPAQLG